MHCICCPKRFGDFKSYSQRLSSTVTNSSKNWLHQIQFGFETYNYFLFTVFSYKMNKNLKTKLILWYFQLCGFCHLTSFEQFNKKKSTQLLTAWSYFHLLMISITVFVAIFYANQFFVMREMITALADITELLLPIFSQYIIIIESLRTNYIKYRFWIRVQHMDTFLLNTTMQMKEMSINKFIIKCALVLVITTSVEIFAAIRVRSDEVWCNHILLSLYASIVCRSEVLFCVFFIDTLKYRTNMIAMRLKGIRNAGKNRLNILRCCKKSYGMLWLCVEDINDAFG